MSDWFKSLWKDSLVYGIGYGVSRFLQIIILPIIAQALTLSEFGYYSNYVIFYSFAGGLFILGLDSAVTRYFFDTDDKKYHQHIFSSAFFFILLVSILSVAVFFAFSPSILHFLNIPPSYAESMVYVLLGIPAITMNGFLLSWFKWQRQKFYFLFNSGGTVVLLLLPLVVVSGVTFTYIFQVIFFSQLIIAAISVFFARKYIRFCYHPELMGSLLRYGFPWMLVFLFGASRTYLDRIFLTQYLNDDLYGLYNFSVRLASLLSLLITAFDMSFGPLAFSIWNKAGAPLFFSRLQSLYTLMISAIACLICVASPLIIQLLGGEKYAGAEKILPLLLFAAIPLSLINFSNLGTSYAKKSFLSTLSLFVGFAGVLLFNFLLTQRYLQYGATASSLIGHLFIIVTGYYFSAKYYKIPFSYAKDGFVFLIFFILSLFYVHFPLMGHLYYNILMQLAVLVIVTLLFLLFLFPGEYKKMLAGLKVKA